MALTTQQKTAIKAAILADPALSALPNNSDGNYAIAAALNQNASPSFTARKTNKPSTGKSTFSGKAQSKPSGYGIAFDIQRGGSLTVQHLIIENPRWSLLRLKDFSPNNCWYDLSGIWVDTMQTPDTSFTWVEYVGDPVAAGWSKYTIKLDAFTGTQQKPIEQHPQYKVPAILPREDWHVNIHHVKQGQ